MKRTLSSGSLDKHHVAVINRMTKSSLGRKGFISLLLPGDSLSQGEVRTGTWKQEPNQRPRKSAASWLIPDGLFRMTDLSPGGLVEAFS